MTLRDSAVRALQGWNAPSSGQEELRAAYVAHLDAHPDGVWRSCFPDHLTAGTLVVSAELDRVLLNLHRKAGRWFHFGGHCETDDRTLAEAARREAVEESGLRTEELDLHPEPAQLDVHAVEFCGDRGTVRHLDVRYVARARPGAEPVASEESVDVRWWPVDALPVLEPAMHDLIGIARARFGA